METQLYFLITILTGLIAACISNRHQTAGTHFTRITSGSFINDTTSSPSVNWFDFGEDGDDDLYVLKGFGALENQPVYINDITTGIWIKVTLEKGAAFILSFPEKDRKKQDDKTVHFLNIFSGKTVNPYIICRFLPSSHYNFN